MKLTQKLGLLIGGTAIFAAVVLAILGTLLLQQPVASAIRERQLSSATQLMNTIDRTLNERLADIMLLAPAPVVMRLADEPNSSQARSEAARHLKQAVKVVDGWSRIDVIGRDDVVLASTDEKLIGQSKATDSAAKTAIDKARGGELSYSDAALDKANQLPTLIFAAPIRQEQNPGRPVVATVVGRLAWQHVLDILKSVNLPTVNLYDSLGTEIGNKDDIEDIFIENQSDHPAVQKALDGQDGTDVVPASDSSVETLTSFVKQKGYGNYKGNGWALTIETPTSIAFASSDVAGLTLVLALVSVMGLGTFTSIWLVARAVRPISSLTASANRLAIGDLSHRVHIATRDELGQLAGAFNNMADRLQQLYKGLEAKVKEKTVKLALRAEQAEADAAKDEAVLSSIGEGLIAVNPEGRIVRVNQQALELFGMTIESMLGKKILDAVTFYGEKGEKLDEDRRPSAEALDKSQRTAGVYQIQQPGGNKIVIAVVSSPVMLKDRAAGVIMIIRDVTKEKEVDRMKTEFISLASHQLRTPLSAIKWFSEMLLAGDAGKLQQEQEDFTKNIYDSTQRMIELVNALLNISRIESGRIIVDPRPTDLKDLIDGIVDDLKIKIEGKKQRLVVDVHKDLPKVNLDPRLIGQVYMNFLTNSIKYTPQGGEISVFVSRKGNELVSQITDTGYGIPAAQQDRIFQKFFRAENIIKIETDGTGLGMYLVKAIIESSGGKVWFKSEENKGTTFWFSLPMSGMKAKEGEVTLDV